MSRTAQQSNVSYRGRMDGSTLVRRCVDCSRLYGCEIAEAWPWPVSGPLPLSCPLDLEPEKPDEEPEG